MLFNSSAFAVFFPVVTAAYFLAPGRFRWAILLGASSIFYMLMASSADRRLVVEAEVTIRAIAAELRVDVVGSFDPGRCGCGEQEFLDGAHPLESCIERMVNGV